MNSPFGRRGSICAHLGWTWDYLHHDIPWGIVRRILIDAPGYETDGNSDKKIAITNENAAELLEKINRLKR